MSVPRALLARPRAWLARVGSPYPCASVLALAAFAAYDGVRTPGVRDALFAPSLAGLVLLLGVLHGLAWQAAHTLVARLPRQAQQALWWFASCFAGGLLALRLGVFTRLEGRHATTALAVLGTCAAGAVGLALLLVAMQPSADHPRGYLGSLRRRARVALSGLLLLAAGLLAVGDRTLYVSLYPDAHLALRLAALALGTRALVLVDAELRLPRLLPSTALLVLVAGALPFALVDAGRPRLVEAFAVRPWCAALLDAARAATDLDRDGYASLLGGGDCAPFDPRVHPAAREIPDNGVDDNCMFGDAERITSIAEPAVPAREPSPLDVVLVTVDTLRADRLGVYAPAFRGAGRATSPNLVRWAASATVFERAYTSGGWTSIAISSLMHGLYPRRLRWTRYYETTRSLVVRKHELAKLLPGDRAERMFPLAFDDPRRPLALRLQRRGMKTAAIVDDGYTEMLKRGTGLERGFGALYDVDNQPYGKRNDEGAVDLALRVLRETPAGTRFFLWLHLFGPHAPNERHPSVPSFGTSPADLYDHELAFLDTQLARLFAGIASRAHPVAVLLAADHGELLYPTMRLHGQTLDEGAIRIPLIAKVPGWPAGRVRTPVSLVDLAPTILALTRTPFMAQLDGMDLGLLASGKGPASRILLTDTWLFQRRTGDDPEEPYLDLVAAHDGERKVVFDRLRNASSGYETKREGTPDAASVPIASEDLWQVLRAYIVDTGGNLRLGD